MQHFNFSQQPERVMEEYLQKSDIFYQRQVPFMDHKYRCDFMIELSDFMGIIEVDENQHKHEKDKDHFHRMNVIESSIRATLVEHNVNKPIVFFRVNPNSFQIDERKIIHDMEDQLTFVCAFIKSYQPESTYDIVYLFYDKMQGNLLLNNFCLFEDLEVGRYFCLTMHESLDVLIFFETYYYENNSKFLCLTHF